MSNEKNKISNKELLDFLKFSYFGDLNISIEVASKRAYRDMCRTLRFGVLPIDTKDSIISDLKESVNVIFKKEIPIINEGSITSQEKFDSWHCKVCENMKNLYYEKGINFTYGQAQKWLNMMIKYLYILEVEEYTFDSVFEYLHIPIDEYILKGVEDELEIKRPVYVWSRWDNYDEYLKYQKDIRERIEKDKNIDVPPLLWEFENWLEVAKGNNKK